MTAKGSAAWYADRRAGAPAEHDDLRVMRIARANGMFYEPGERAVFEVWFRESRRGKGASYVDIALRRHPERHSEYEAEPTQRHWHTWQMAVGAGRLLPKYDPYKLAAAALAAKASEVTP